MEEIYQNTAVDDQEVYEEPQQTPTPTPTPRNTVQSQPAPQRTTKKSITREERQVVASSGHNYCTLAMATANGTSPPPSDGVKNKKTLIPEKLRSINIKLILLIGFVCLLVLCLILAITALAVTMSTSSKLQDDIAELRQELNLVKSMMTSASPSPNAATTTQVETTTQRSTTTTTGGSTASGVSTTSQVLSTTRRLLG